MSSVFITAKNQVEKHHPVDFLRDIVQVLVIWILSVGERVREVSVRQETLRMERGSRRLRGAAPPFVLS